ncbi:MAG: hypothetical protein IPL79_07335 [Myxococcales bacterium]|nr:hypothetical protein [Myxococcales bacterium]
MSRLASRSTDIQGLTGYSRCASMRLILLSAPSLATDALRVSLLASQAFVSVDVVSDAPALAVHLRAGIGGAVVDADLYASLSPELLAQVDAVPTVRIALHARDQDQRRIAVADGHDGSVAGVIARLLSQATSPAHPIHARRLSRRESQVLGHLATGMTNREIAALLAISIKTVDTHRGQLLKKLGLRNNSDLTRYALGHGIAPAGGTIVPPLAR